MPGPGVRSGKRVIRRGTGGAPRQARDVTHYTPTRAPAPRNHDYGDEGGIAPAVPNVAGTLRSADNTVRARKEIKRIKRTVQDFPTAVGGIATDTPVTFKQSAKFGGESHTLGWRGLYESGISRTKGMPPKPYHDIQLAEDVVSALGTRAKDFPKAVRPIVRDRKNDARQVVLHELVHANQRKDLSHTMLEGGAEALSRRIAKREYGSPGTGGVYLPEIADLKRAAGGGRLVGQTEGALHRSHYDPTEFKDILYREMLRPRRRR